MGDVRIGVASCDPDGLIATPVETVPRGPGDLQRIEALVDEHGAVEVVLGLPRSLSGGEGPSAAKAREFGRALADVLAPLSVGVRLVDERLTTVSAEAVLRQQGRKGKSRRAVVDQAAAVIILQNALDAERATGHAPGEAVSGKDTSDQGDP